VRATGRRVRQEIDADWVETRAHAGWRAANIATASQATANCQGQRSERAIKQGAYAMWSKFFSSNLFLCSAQKFSLCTGVHDSTPDCSSVLYISNELWKSNTGTRAQQQVSTAAARASAGCVEASTESGQAGDDRGTARHATHTARMTQAAQAQANSADRNRATHLSCAMRAESASMTDWMSLGRSASFHLRAANLKRH
jgi:hypothetical protein